jgi:dolichol-phosphate mannosyltransferase
VAGVEGPPPRAPDGARGLVIIPTYNERENVERIVADVLAQDARLHVLVVDDGSPDGTGAIAGRDRRQVGGPRHVLHRAGKLGLGTGLRGGIPVGARA